MFKCVWGVVLEGHHCGRAGEISWNGDRICSLNTWAFASCACFSIHHFSSYSSSVLEGNVDKFFDFLCSDAVEDSWIPEEIYFLLTETQLHNQWAQELTGHPKVKLRDKFTNKAHGKRWCYLYRYSKAKDFST